MASTANPSKVVSLDDVRQQRGSAAPLQFTSGPEAGSYSATQVQRSGVIVGDEWESTFAGWTTSTVTLPSGDFFYVSTPSGQPKSHEVLFPGDSEDYLHVTLGRDEAVAPKPTREDAKEAAMSDNGVSREEMQAELRALRAESKEQFALILGEVKTANAAVTGAITTLRADLNGDMNTFRADIGGKLEVVASKSAGKWTVWTAAGAIIVALIGTLLVLLQVAQAGYDTGRERERGNREQIQTEVQKALPKPSPAR